jgi:glutathione S-transferase
LAERWLAAVERTIVALAQDADMPASRGQPDIGDLAIAVGLAYIDFRLQAVRWRESAPALAGWLDAIGERPSLRVTRPE